MLTANQLFNETYYLDNNLDLSVALSNGIITSGFDHFNTVGRLENRSPSGFFNSNFYLQTHSDVALAVQNNIITAFDHFILYGQFETRNPNSEFNTFLYLQENPDVAAAVQRDEITAFGHFVEYGIQEGRSPASIFNQPNPEKLAFSLDNYTIEHQGLNNVNINVEYTYKEGITYSEYRDYAPIAQSVNQFLVNYPNETDFWEILNKNLTERLLAENPVMQSLTVDIDVLPSVFLPYQISSTVTRDRQGKLDEKFNFTIPQYTIEHQGLNTLNLDVDYTYKPGISNSEYPDFRPIYNRINNFLINYPNETDFWEIVNKNLTQQIFLENPVFADFKVNLEVLPNNGLPSIQSTVTRSLEGLREEFSIKLPNYPIQHQGLNNLNLEVNYLYKQGINNNEYPDFEPIYQGIDEYLRNYPNETDFWEIVNKNLTGKVLAENPVIEGITSNLNVLPSIAEPYNISSIVTRNRQGLLEEKWNFKIPEYPIVHQGLNTLNVDVNYTYKQGITDAEYPDFRPIYRRVDEVLRNYPDENQFWEIVNRNLTSLVLRENPVLADATIGLSVLPTENLPYNLRSVVTRSRF